MLSLVVILALAFVLLASMFVWVPLLQSVEGQARRYSRQLPEEIPDLREDDTSPQFTGRID